MLSFIERLFNVSGTETIMLVQKKISSIVTILLLSIEGLENMVGSEDIRSVRIKGTFDSIELKSICSPCTSNISIVLRSLEKLLVVGIDSVAQTLTIKRIWKLCRKLVYKLYYNRIQP
jgi:hypothetical protein